MLREAGPEFVQTQGRKNMAELQVISDSIQFLLLPYKRYSTQSGAMSETVKETAEGVTEMIEMRKMVKEIVQETTDMIEIGKEMKETV
ncbi:unnamed protein product [Arctogadus glacialis]